MSDNWFRNHGAEFFRKFTDAELAASVEQWLEAHDGAMDRVIFNVFSDKDRMIYEHLFQ